MQLLWLTFMAVVATATAQLNEEEFVEIADVTEENDLNVTDIERLEKNGEVKEYLQSLLRYDSVSSLKKASFSDQPQAFDTLLSSRRSSAAMFDSRSATNQAEAELVAEVDQAAPSLSLSDDARLASASLTGDVLSKTLLGSPTNLYHCSHRTYLLRWFPLYSRYTATHFCFVPWAANQAITYAKCSGRCALNYNRRGRCRPSCYTRRRIRVLCYSFRLRRWQWQSVVRNLPQACRCSTC